MVLVTTDGGFWWAAGPLNPFTGSGATHQHQECTGRVYDAERGGTGQYTGTGINQLPAAISELAIRRATHYLGEALRDYLVTGPEIHYTAENSDILTSIGFRPDKASRADNQQKYTPAHNHVYAHQQQPPANNRPENPAI
jgi:hypothetical protein